MLGRFCSQYEKSNSILISKKKHPKPLHLHLHFLSVKESSHLCKVRDNSTANQQNYLSWFFSSEKITRPHSAWFHAWHCRAHWKRCWICLLVNGGYLLALIYLKQLVNDNIWLIWRLSLGSWRELCRSLADLPPLEGFWWAIEMLQYWLFCFPFSVNNSFPIRLSTFLQLNNFFQWKQNSQKLTVHSWALHR